MASSSEACGVLARRAATPFLTQELPGDPARLRYDFAVQLLALCLALAPSAPDAQLADAESPAIDWTRQCCPEVALVELKLGELHDPFEVAASTRRGTDDQELKLHPLKNPFVGS